MNKYMNKAIGNISGCLVLTVMLGVFLPACQKGPDFSNKVYITQAKYSPYASIVLNNGVGSIKLGVSSIYKMDKDLRISFVPQDDTFLESYNKEHRTEYQLIPSEAVSYSARDVNIALHQAFSPEITVTIKKWNGYRSGIDYALPLKVSGGDLPVVSGSDYILLELSEQVISNAALLDVKNNAGFKLINPDNFWPEMTGKPYGKVTVEGKIMYTKTFSVPGNWRSDFFVGFGLQLLTSPDGNLNIRFPDAKFIGSFGKLSLNRWHHFAVTNDNGVISGYLDGELKISSSYTGELNSRAFTIAGYVTNCGLAVDEFRIWKTVRSPKQIKKYQCIADPSNPDLLAYYRFNESTGSIAKDETGNKNDIQTTEKVTWLEGISCP